MKISEKTQKTRYLIWEAWDKLNLYSNEVFPFSCVPFPSLFQCFNNGRGTGGIGNDFHEKTSPLSLESWNFKGETFESSVTVTSRYGFQGSGLSSLSLILNILRKKSFHISCRCLPLPVKKLQKMFSGRGFENLGTRYWKPTPHRRHSRACY